MVSGRGRNCTIWTILGAGAGTSSADATPEHALAVAATRGVAQADWIVMQVGLKPAPGHTWRLDRNFTSWTILVV
jgi:hypothetical protein